MKDVAVARDVRTWSMRQWEQHLGDRPAVGVFSAAEIAGLPEPVQRYFESAVAIGTPLVPSVRFRMRGQLKLRRWLPFRARQVLDPHTGFIWAARVAGVIAGHDRYLDGDGEMNWKLAGVVNVAHGDGPDISISTAGRCGVEAIMLPISLLPRFGVTWTAADEAHIAAHFHVGPTPIDIDLTIDRTGHIRSVAVQRWGDPDGTGTWRWCPFGGEISEQRTFAGLTIPSVGRLGWNAGTEGWPTGEFFRFEITSLDVPAAQGGFDR